MVIGDALAAALLPDDELLPLELHAARTATAARDVSADTPIVTGGRLDDLPVMFNASSPYRVAQEES
jgi:hypothetical protein